MTIFSNFRVRLTVLLLCVSPAVATEYEIYRNNEVIRGVNLDYDVLLKLDVLVGEPVVTLKVRWEPSRSLSIVEVPSLVRGLDPVETVRLNELPSEAAEKINMIDFDLVFEFDLTGMGFSQDRAFLVEDAGAMARSDGMTWSFNPSGSPNWSSFLLSANPSQTTMFGTSIDLEEPANYFSRDEARGIFALILADRLPAPTVAVFNGEISFYDLQNWVVRESDYFEIAQTRLAVQTIKEGIWRSFGLSISDQDIEATTQDVNGARDFVENLSNLPDTVKGTGDSAEYDRLLEQGLLILDEMEVSKKYWESRENEPEPFPEGNDGTFENREPSSPSERFSSVCFSLGNGYLADSVLDVNAVNEMLAGVNSRLPDYAESGNYRLVGDLRLSCSGSQDLVGGIEIHAHDVTKNFRCESGGTSSRSVRQLISNYYPDEQCTVREYVAITSEGRLDGQ